MQNYSVDAEIYVKMNKKLIKRRALIIGVAVFFVFAVIFLFKLILGLAKGKSSSVNGGVTTYKDSVKVVCEAKILNTGDLLIHSPVLKAYYDENSRSYNFEKIFTYLSSYNKNFDYCGINLEGTLAESNFSGYPLFRCPGSLIDYAKEAGFNMFLTANNHANDAGAEGFKKTTEILRSKNVDFIGRKVNENDKKYIIKEINGIKVGMVNYTYGEISDSGIASVNGIPSSAQNSKLLNVFDYKKLQDFYSEQKKIIEEMKKLGAEKIIYYMHWGDEYQLKESKIQRSIAQKLSDLGVDVIVGGHPHVVQPMDVIHSDISGKDTICIYSVGNAVSNQRKELMNLNTGHTEDGVLFLVTFTKYSDGKVLTTNIDVVPTWVHLYTGKDGKRAYVIIPLDKKLDWKNDLGLNSSTDGFESANASFERTMKLLASGLEKAKDVVLKNMVSAYPKIYKR